MYALPFLGADSLVGSNVMEEGAAIGLFSFYGSTEFVLVDM